MTKRAFYYKILNLPPTASLEEVKRAYRKLSLECHPDRSPSPDAAARFRAIADAYNYLSNHRDEEQELDFKSNLNFDRIFYERSSSKRVQKRAILRINFVDAILGATKVVKTATRNYIVPIPAGTQPNDTLVVEDLYVKIIVILPKKLSESQKEILKNF